MGFPITHQRYGATNNSFSGSAAAPARHDAVALSAAVRAPDARVLDGGGLLFEPSN